MAKWIMRIRLQQNSDQFYYHKVLLSVRMSSRYKHAWWVVWDNDFLWPPNLHEGRLIWKSRYITVITAVIMNVSAGASNVKSSTSSAKKTPSDLADLIVSIHFVIHHLSVQFTNAFWYMASRVLKRRGTAHMIVSTSQYSVIIPINFMMASHI